MHFQGEKKNIRKNGMGKFHQICYKSQKHAKVPEKATTFACFFNHFVVFSPKTEGESGSNTG
jgi:hypothetical protein